MSFQTPILSGRTLSPECDTSSVTCFAPAYEHDDTLAVAVVNAARNSRKSSHSPMQVVDNKEIESRGIVMAHEAVRTLAGISVKDYGGIGGLKTVSVRNLGAQHTAISYDGFAISDAQNGQVDISGFMLDNVSEIGAILGPSDEIFLNARLTAASGTLFIKTKRVEQPFEAKVGLNAGCFGTWNPQIYLGGRKGRTSMQVNANYLTSKGSYPFMLRNGMLQTREKRLNSDVSTLNTEINLEHKTPGNSGTFSFKATFADSERGLPGAVILYYQNPTERLWDNKTGIYTKYNWYLSDTWKAEVAASYSRSSNRYINTDAALSKPEDNRYLQQEVYLTAVAGYRHGRWSFSAAEDLFCNILDSDIPECPYPVGFNSITAVSARYTSNRMKITASLTGRYVKHWLRTGLMENSAVIVTPPHPMFRLSPSISFTYSFLKDESLLLRASVKDGYRVPTFNDLYYARVGNTGLTPEKALMTNLGFVYSHTSRSVDCIASIDGYFNMVRDKIAATPTMFIWKMRNIGKVMMTGLDAMCQVDWKPYKKINIHAEVSYSLQYALDITDRESKSYRHQIPYSPRHAASAVISVHTHWVTATYTLIGASKRYILPQNIRHNMIEAYTDHSVSLGRTFKISPVSLNINLEALNLSDVNYEIIKGYPMSGRAFRISLKIKY